MDEKRPGANISPMQIMQMAKALRGNKNAANETSQLENLAQTGITQEQQAQLLNVLNDKEKLNKVLASPQAQALMKTLGAKQG